MDNLTKWWVNYKALTPEELILASTMSDHSVKIEDNDKWEILAEKFRNKIPNGQSLKNHKLGVMKCATDIITTLFDKYIDEDTLFISSKCEHGAVDKNIDSHNLYDKGLFLDLYFTQFNTTPIRDRLKEKKYKRAFVYIIGTQIINGRVTPQLYYQKIKEYLESQGLETILVIDDVHGLYSIPRDYSIFDYVIATGHAMLRLYDLGIVWSKKEQIGYKYINWLDTFLNGLDIILSRKDKLEYFNQVMRNEYMEYIIKYPEIFSYGDNPAPHIFAIRVDCPPKYAYDKNKYEIFAKNEIWFETEKYKDHDLFYIRVRGAQFMTYPILIEKTIPMIKSFLDKIVLIHNEIEGI